MSSRKVGDWWSGHDYLSDLITPDSWFDVMKDWDSWRKSGYRMFFRGESACLNENCSSQEVNSKPGESLLSCSYKPYPLLPSLLRDQNYTNLSKTWKSTAGDPKKLERQLLEHYIRHTAHLIESEGQFAGRTLADLEILCLAQHYGLPTRLLDWSLNPFIALYFALAGSWRRGNFNENEPARLWVMVLKEEEKRKERTIHLERKNHRITKLDEVVQLDIKEENESWFEEAPFIVVPLVFTQRIAAQSGRFVYCSNLTKGNTTKDESERNSNNIRLDRIITKHILPKGRQQKSEKAFVNKLSGLDEKKYFFINDKEGFVQGHENEFGHDMKVYPWEHLICYPITYGDDKHTMLKQLEFRGYHAGHLFPDLGGWATYLQQGFR